MKVYHQFYCPQNVLVMDMELAKQLWASDDVSAWRTALSKYPAVLEHFASTAPRRKELPELDKWIQNDLLKRISNAKTPVLTREDLSKLIKYKLARGKFRPRLQQFIDGLDPKEVETVTREAMQTIMQSPKGDSDKAIGKAMNTLTSLKGVGPAFASFLLSLVSEEVAFMSDELLLVTGERNYDTKRLKQLNASICEKRRALGNELSGFEIEQCIFAEAHPTDASSTNKISPNKRAAQPSSNEATVDSKKTKHK